VESKVIKIQIEIRLFFVSEEVNLFLLQINTMVLRGWINIHIPVLVGDVDGDEDRDVGPGREVETPSRCRSDGQHTL